MKIVSQISFIILLVVAFASCKKSGNDPVPLVNATFNFEHFVDNEQVQFNNIRYTNAFGNLYSVETIKYFVSDITLHMQDGVDVFFDEEHYIDALDPSTTSFTPSGKFVPGEVIAISFIFGLNQEKNVSGRFPNPPESNMEWPIALGPGYHYMKLEGKIDSSGTINNYLAHTGATNGNQNYINVDLPVPEFSVGNSGVTIAIKMNINNWWDNPNTFDLNEMSMIMGNQAVQQKLHDNGTDVFTILSIE
jgi:hypothetical protein